MTPQQIIDTIWSADMAPKQELKEYCRGQIHDVLRTMLADLSRQDAADHPEGSWTVAMLWLIAQVEALQLDRDSLVEQNNGLRATLDARKAVLSGVLQQAKDLTSQDQND